MNFRFQSTSIIFIILCIFIMFFSVFMSSALFDNNPLWLISWTMITIFGVTTSLLFLFKSEKLRIKHINNILFEKCDPPEFLRVFSPIVDRATTLRKNKLWAQTVFACGYVFNGEYEKAERLLLSVYELSDSKRMTKYNKFISAMLCSLYCDMESKEKATSFYQIVSDYENNLPGGIKLSDSDVRLFTSVKNSIKLLNGDFEGLDEYYQQRFLDSKSNLDKIECKFCLAKIYENNGDKEKAHEYYRYVADNGNKIYDATIAREKLS